MPECLIRDWCPSCSVPPSFSGRVVVVSYLPAICAFSAYATEYSRYYLQGLQGPDEHTLADRYQRCQVFPKRISWSVHAE